jgi:surfeit locus 1 family protein
MSLTARRLVMGVLLLAAVGFARLGVWQLQRLRERRAANVALTAARTAAPIALPPVPSAPEALAEHRVVARGRYDHRHEIIVRGVVLQGVPGVHVVTPLLLSEGGPAVLVDRGFLPAPDAVTVDLHGSEEPGDQVVSGIALPVGTLPGEPIDRAGLTTWRRLDLAALRARLPYPVLSVYVKQFPGSGVPAFPRREAPPAPDDGPHLSYAIQWFLFAVLAVAFALLVVGRNAGSRGGASG